MPHRKDRDSSHNYEKATITNSYFYCNEKKPNLINKDFLPNYFSFLESIVSSFKGVVLKYLKRYEENKIVSLYEVAERKTLPRSADKLLEQVRNPNKKLTVNLSVPQIGYLFKMLQDLKILEAPTNKDIQEFISANFRPSSKGDSNTDISVGKLARLWSDFDAITASFWMKKFIELHNQARKDNPNKI